MNLSVIKLKSHLIQFFAQCPVVNERVAVYDSQEIDVCDQQATWWRCTICGGWHVCLKKVVWEEVKTVKAQYLNKFPNSNLSRDWRLGD